MAYGDDKMEVVIENLPERGTGLGGRERDTGGGGQFYDLKRPEKYPFDTLNWPHE